MSLTEGNTRTVRVVRRCYIAGPMTHIPAFNFPAFDAAAVKLRLEGYDVISPSELDNAADRAAALASPDGNILDYGKGVKQTWGDFLARDVKLIADGDSRGTIDFVFVLPGWEKSRGARLETFVAYALCGKIIVSYETRQRLGALTLVKAWAGGLWVDAMDQFLGRSPEYVR